MTPRPSTPGPGSPVSPLAILVARWVPVALWMGVIFTFSSATSLPQAPNDLIDAIVKKGAHFGEFAVLATLVHRALSAGGRTWLAILGSLAFAVAYAISDELHQTLVPGRHPSIVDVGIDTLGSTLALGFIVSRGGIGGEMASQG